MESVVGRLHVSVLTLRADAWVASKATCAAFRAHTRLQDERVVQTGAGREALCHISALAGVCTWVAMMMVESRV